MLLHLEWEGPLTYENAKKQRNAKTDYGIYQIYGSHPAYGSDSLLYIGKADKQTFGLRLSQETWEFHNHDATRLAVYLGRLAGYGKTPKASVWSEQIALAEKLLIYAHWPAANSSGLNVSLSKNVHDLHILNWGKFRDLLPEVSGARYSDLYSSFESYKIYGSKSGEA